MQKTHLQESQLDHVHHIAINVSDIEKAVKWYTGSFHCRVIIQEKTVAVLQFANIRVALTLPSLDPPHLAFERQDAAALGELQDRADGVRSTFLADSTGNLVEIIEE